MTDRLSISWSGLQRYEACHAKHKLVMEKKGRKVDGRIFLPGTVCDRTMRRWLESSDPRPGDMLEYLPEVFEQYTTPGVEQEYSIKWRHVDDKKAVLDFCREVLTALEPTLLKLVIPYEYQPEMRFRTPVGIPYLDGKLTSIDLVGGIDITVRMPDGSFRLWDLKVTKDDRYIRKTLGQGIFYDIAFTAAFQQPTSFGFIVPAIQSKPIMADYDDDGRRVMLSRIIKMAHGIWRGEWDPTQETLSECNRCEVYHVCPRWALQPVKDAQGRNRVTFSPTVKREVDSV